MDPFEDDINEINAAVRPALEALGAEGVEIVMRGEPGHVALHVGYSLAQGVERSSAELRAALEPLLPARVDFEALHVCELHALPVDERAAEAPSRGFRVPLWASALAIVLLIGAGLALFRFTVFSQRGEIVARARLRGAGKTTARFHSEGKTLVLWATLDASWKPKTRSRTLKKIVPVHFEVDFVRAGKVVRHLAFDTQRRRHITSLYCKVAPRCEIRIAALAGLPTGLIEMRVTGKPRADVTTVRDMSLNLRD